jgi:hypothetical protein
MKKFRLLIALLSIILLASLSGVEGQQVPYSASSGYSAIPNAISSGYPTIQTTQVGQTTDVSQYTQYYTVGPAPSTHITAPQQFITDGSAPAYSQYQSTPAYAGGDSLWIKGLSSWTQYVAVPQGSSIQLLALSPNGGEGFITEIDPNGKINNYNFYFYPASLLSFYADTPGRHTLSFVLAGQPSNQVVIDVVGTYKAPIY